jgi:hypothetical protein
MPRKTSPNTETDALWLDAFQRALVKKIKEPDGIGWLTLNEFRARTKLGQGKGEWFVRAEMKAGRMERFRGSQTRPSGAIAPQTWYRPLAAGKRIL